MTPVQCQTYKYNKTDKNKRRFVSIMTFPFSFSAMALTIHNASTQIPSLKNPFFLATGEMVASMEDLGDETLSAVVVELDRRLFCFCADAALKISAESASARRATVLSIVASSGMLSGATLDAVNATWVAGRRVRKVWADVDDDEVEDGMVAGGWLVCWSVCWVQLSFSLGVVL